MLTAKATGRTKSSLVYSVTNILNVVGFIVKSITTCGRIPLFFLLYNIWKLVEFVIRGNYLMNKLSIFVQYIWQTISFSYLCRHLIELQHIVSVLANWKAPQVQKTKKGTRILMRIDCSVESFIMQWTFAIPIGVSKYNDTALHPLHLSHCHA